MYIDTELPTRTEPMLLEPQALLSGVKNGNRLMFTLCYDRYHRGIYLFVLKYVRCEALAEDIVQSKAHEIDCIFKLRASVHKLSQGMLELAKQIPIYHEPAEINKTEADNDEG